MRALVTGLVATSVLAAMGGQASALKQSAHRSITWHACDDAGLPDAFCDRLGVAAYDVDRYEWNTPAAHAQMAAGQSACDGANATLARVRDLGASVRSNLAKQAAAPSAKGAEQIAIQLGRALHTVQDNCAHQGMPNPEHAWDSISDICVGTKLSPDIQTEAFSCARDETELVIDAFLGAMDSAGVTDADLSDVPAGYTHWPDHEDVCDFLAGASDWDGVDRHWNNQVMAPALRNQLTGAFASPSVQAFDICSNGAGVLAPDESPATVDVSRGPRSCPGITLYCLIKADGSTSDGPPPWDDGSGDEELQPAGCAVGHTSGAGATLLMIGLGALLVGRRRR